MCLQAYDFVELHRRYGCTLQMGGSDQWGNIITGLDLGRRLGTTQLYALTSPLITTASGAKMGKTAAGAVWLDAALLSPYDYWQFWRNTEDADVGRFLQAVHACCRSTRSRGSRRSAEPRSTRPRKSLATEATALLHGREAARGRRRDRAPDLRGRRARREPADGRCARGRIRRGPRRARRLRARRPRRLDRRSAPPDSRRRPAVNDVALTDERAMISRDALAAAGVVKLSLGRKKHVLLRAV